MFDFLKNKKTPEAKATETPSTMEIPQPKQYADEIEQIHDEFNCAGANLLQEAFDIIKEAESKDIDKGTRLKSLGFTSTPQALEAADVIRKKAEALLTSRLVREYAFKYPNNKFITELQVKTICEKYNLVFGESTRFKGFVPATNLEAMEKFSLHVSDVDKHVCINEEDGCVLNISESDFTQNGLNYAIIGGSSFFVTDSNGKSPYTTSPILTKECIERFSNTRFLKAHAVKQKNTELKICAPLKDMDTSGMRLVGHKIQHVPDPVVLKPVMGGYLIVTAWGDEASDENVVNQNHN